MPAVPAPEKLAEGELPEKLDLFCRETLVVPAGHGLAGRPMVLLPFVKNFLTDLHQPGISEGALFTARKNSKTSSIALYLLFHLIGKHRVEGFRAGVVSISKLKARELLRCMEEIYKASPKLTGARFYSTPAPGKVVSDSGEIEILSLESSGGHSSSLQIAIADEIGLLDPRGAGASQ